MAFSKIKSFLFNFFHFNKQERNGVFVLGCIIVFLFSIKLFLPYFGNGNQLVVINVLNSEKNEFPNTQSSDVEKQVENKVFISSEKFVFNPNTISKEDALRLGFSEKLVNRLINFRNKGGKFFKPEDLKKLYGISERLYEELENYILIPNKKTATKSDSIDYKISLVAKKKSSPSLLEINSADSLSIVYLKGIGPGYTKRIIKYRNLLGGFHTINQLKEIYGMTDSLFSLLSSQININSNAVTKISINTIDFNSLKKHPYFNFQSAQAIINFRTKHGKLNELDIKSMPIFSEEKLALILPYLSY
jgi:competence protein ComEA